MKSSSEECVPKLKQYHEKVLRALYELQEEEKHLLEFQEEELEERNRQHVERLKVQLVQLEEENSQLHKKLFELQQRLDQEENVKDWLHHEAAHWVISRDEIQMTQEVLGKGSYGEVRVAKFRGITVAAKCLHGMILSRYNLGLFTREMEIASQLRHPNLVQFIGATKEGDPIIITELMSTSLHKELERGSNLTKLAILAISHDIACGLNYLHLWKPHPILHRDVCSSNVLLENIARGWRAKLSDFGSANLQSHVHTEIPGNPYYAAPEARDPESHSPAMDVYSYGVVLLEMVLCQPPGPSRADKLRQLGTVKWPLMELIIKRCISEDYHQRPLIADILEKIVAIKPATPIGAATSARSDLRKQKQIIPKLTTKEWIGEHLYHAIMSTYPKMAGKITGMLLELDNSELLRMLEVPDLLNSKVDEAVLVLREHQLMN